MTDPLKPVTETTASPKPVSKVSATQKEHGPYWHALHLVMKGTWIALLLVAVVFLLLVARIAVGPVSLGPVAPFLKAGLDQNGNELQLEFDDGAVAWLGRNEMRAPGEKQRLLPGFEFRLQNVRVKDQRNQSLLTVPEARLTLSTTALINGEIAPGRIELNGLQLTLDWTKGDLFEALGQGDGEGLGPILAQLLEPPKKGTTVGYLQGIGIRRAEIRLHEALTDSDWLLQDAALILRRSEKSVDLNIGGQLLRVAKTAGEAGIPAPIEITSRLPYNAPATTMVIRFKDFNPTRFAGKSEALTRIKVADMGISGTVGLTFKRGGEAELQDVKLDLSAGRGLVTLPDLYPAPVSFDGAVLKGSYAPARKLLTVSAAQLQFAGAEITAQGRLADNEAGPAIHMTGNISNLPLPLLKTYWPQKLGSGAYNWVSANLTEGRASKASFKVAIDPDMWARAGGMPAEALDMRFAFDGVTAHYLRPMPPIVDGVGAAHLTLHDFSLMAKSASTAGVSIKNSTIRFDDIHLSGKAEAKADLELHGSVPKVLALIDHKPLGYPSAYGMKPGSVQGESVTSLKLTFPLVHDVSLNDVKFDVQAKLDRVVIPELFTGVALKSDHLDLAVTPKNLTGKGLIRLNDVAFSLDWAEDFLAGKGNLSSKFKLKGRVEGKEWDVLSLPFADHVHGPAEVDFTLRGAGPSIKRGEGRIDFKDAALGFRDIGWWKPAGMASEANFRFAKPASDRLMVQDLSYSDPGMKASGSLATSEARGLEKMVIDSLRSGKSMLAATITRSRNNDYDVALTAAALDGSFYINRLLHSKTMAMAPGVPTVAEPDFKLPNFTLDAFAAELYALDGVVTRNVEMTAAYSADRWGTTKVKGDYAKGGRFQFALEAPATAATPKAPRRSFTLLSTNGGETARGMGLFDTAIGGVLTAKGTMTEPGLDQVITASIEARNFRLSKAPILTKILTIGSLTGIRDLLSGDGITFERAIAPLTFDHGIIRIRDGRAWGASIGLTLKGEIGVDSRQAAFGGTIVPSYTANNVLGQLPIIGNLIMGGEGKGLFAFTYSVKGSLENPDVDVNPLSVLTPGFLRWIFEENPKLKKRNLPESPDLPESPAK